MEQDTSRRLMGVREIAAALTQEGSPVSASTISRGLSRCLYPNHGTARQPLLDLDEVRQIRANQLDPEKQRAALIARGQIAPTQDLGDGDAAEAPPTRVPSGTEGQLGQAKLRKYNAEATQAEMDLLERQRSLVPVIEVQDAGFDLGALVREVHAARVPALAAKLVGMTDQRAIAAAIAAADRECEVALSKHAERMLDDQRPA